MAWSSFVRKHIFQSNKVSLSDWVRPILYLRMLSIPTIAGANKNPSYQLAISRRIAPKLSHGRADLIHCTYPMMTSVYILS